MTQTGEIRFESPPHFPAPHYSFTKNKLSSAGIALGKALFYDPILSADSTVSCGSCHIQTFAFADPGKRFSFGINSQNSLRNSPGLFNQAWNTSFMWDGGVNHIEVMPLAPITNELEMGEDISNVIDKLRRSNFYPAMFKKAFGKDTINDQLFLWALAQFQGTMVSASSKYDFYLQGKSELTPSELDGLMVFREHCTVCHSEPLLTDYSFRNNGLDSTFSDTGRGLITSLEPDRGKFKVPSLRNVALTAPYMHDGRFESLDQVIGHYRSGILLSPSLDSTLRNPVLMNETEAESLVLFLYTLTDSAFLANPEYAQNSL